jgi:hypothetical protein
MATTEHAASTDAICARSVEGTVSISQLTARKRITLKTQDRFLEESPHAM